MNALVLYDSMFGNTVRIAETIALAVQEALPTRLSSIDDAGDLSEALHDVDLLVVGVPTQHHGISRPLKAALECLGDHLLTGLRVATFDTRLRGSHLVTGSAAARLGALLRHHGAWVVVAPGSFVVDSREGPLREGETEHARAWAQQVLAAAGVRGPRVPLERAAR